MDLLLKISGSLDVIFIIVGAALEILLTISIYIIYKTLRNRKKIENE